MLNIPERRVRGAYTCPRPAHWGIVSQGPPHSKAALPIASISGSRLIANQSTELRQVEQSPPMLFLSSVLDSRIGRRIGMYDVTATLIQGHAGLSHAPVIVKVLVGGVAVVGLLTTFLRMRR